MTGYQLTFFMQQSGHHDHRPIHQWLLKLIQDMEIRGATLIAGQEGLDHHHRFHSAYFPDMADPPIEVTMVVSEIECENLMARLRTEPGLHLFYAKTRVEFGAIGTPD